VKHPTFALPDTLLEPPPIRNRKFAFACAEPVEDGNSLWKEMEKSAGNYGHGFTGMNTDREIDKKSALFAEFRACPELAEEVGILIPYGFNVEYTVE
jgi:hypothetical protein